MAVFVVTETQGRLELWLTVIFFLLVSLLRNSFLTRKPVFSHLFGVIVSLERSCSQFVLSCPVMTFPDIVWKPNSSTERMNQGSNMRSMVIFPGQLLQFMSRRESEGQGIGGLRNVNAKAMFRHPCS